MGLSILFDNKVLAQDIHFSQFWASPLLLNPANTGNFDGDFRVAAIYRDQWRSISNPFVTYAGSFDRLFRIREEKLGGGIAVFNDAAGIGDLNATKAFISLAYHKDVNNNTLRVGYQIGFVNKRIQRNRLSFPDQFNDETGYFDPRLPNTEGQVEEKLNSLDMGIGIGWGHRLENFTSDLGLGFYHINKPKESFLGTDERLRMRMVFSGSGHWDMTEKVFLMPNVLLMEQSRAINFELGSNVGYRLPENKIKAKAIYGGLFFRDGFPANFDALIGVVGMMIGRFNAGVSYDVNLSDLTAATNYKGAFEISLIYIAPTVKLDKIQIPCDRF